MAAAKDHQEDESVSLSSLLPFSIQTKPRQLTIEQAIADGIYRKPGQETCSFAILFQTIEKIAK